MSKKKEDKYKYIYFGIKPIGKKTIPSTFEQSYERRQLRNWGINKIPTDKLNKFIKIDNINSILSTITKKQQKINESLNNLRKINNKSKKNLNRIRVLNNNYDNLKKLYKEKTNELNSITR